MVYLHIARGDDSSGICYRKTVGEVGLDFARVYDISCLSAERFLDTFFPSGVSMLWSQVIVTYLSAYHCSETFSMDPCVTLLSYLQKQRFKQFCWHSSMLADA